MASPDFAANIGFILSSQFSLAFRRRYPRFTFETRVTDTVIPLAPTGSGVIRHKKALVVFHGVRENDHVEASVEQRVMTVTPPCEELTMDVLGFIHKLASVLPDNREWSCEFVFPLPQDNVEDEEDGDDSDDGSVGIILDIKHAIKKAKNVEVEDDKTAVWKFQTNQAEDANCSLVEMRLGPRGLFTKDVSGEEREFTPEGIFRRMCKRKQPSDLPLVPATPPPPRSDSPDI